MTGNSPQGPEYDLWLSFRKAHEAIHKVRKVELRPFRLSTVETAVLLTVHGANNDVTPAEISRELLKDPHSISQLLERMEKRGLLKRTKGYPRKNMIKISLTKKGREAYEKSITGDRISLIMSSLSDKERKQFGEYLDTLREKALEVLG